ncbi:MAG: helix-turn-helix domain-containing protein [Propionibacteriales bacterium]|nr:helix-turn-helix domain-containing protein [Propionibacteriales bacterium]
MQTTARPLETVERAIAVLDLLAESDSDLGNNEIARRTGINASTVSRLLATLVRANLVHRVPETGRHRLGPRLVVLGNAALSRIDLRALAHAHLEELAETTGETATLSIPDRNTVMTVDFVQSPQSVRSVAEMGRPSVPHATATGKVFLAYGGTLPPGRLRSYTRRTIVSRARLSAVLVRVRESGWAEAVEEREEHLNAVAASINRPNGELVGVLGLQGPSTRLDLAAREAAADRLVDHAADLARGAARGLV